MSILMTDGQLRALHDLRRKRAGETVPFVNIADAQTLTARGLALRTPEGWAITAEGEALLAALTAAGRDPTPERPRLSLIRP